MIEVELKFPVPSLASMRQTFLDMGAVSQARSTQADEYLNDPLRDFAKLDLALRIRQNDDAYELTFKGPNLDPTAKIRQEIEIKLADAKSAEQMKQVFEGIGFYSVAKVVKQRQTLELDWQQEKIHICLDEVDEVGGFVELELVVANKSLVQAAKNHLFDLATAVGLSESTRTSYLEMLLRQRGEL